MFRNGLIYLLKDITIFFFFFRVNSFMTRKRGLSLHFLLLRLVLIHHWMGKKYRNMKHLKDLEEISQTVLKMIQIRNVFK